MDYHLKEGGHVTGFRGDLGAAGTQGRLGEHFPGGVEVHSVWGSPDP